jgi:hypothetical protein
VSCVLGGLSCLPRGPNFEGMMREEKGGREEGEGRTHGRMGLEKDGASEKEKNVLVP